jgi:hypothetical protein
MKHIHHIVPKYMGGTDEPSNLIELTVEEHAEAHRILFEKHGRKEDELAWKGLSGIIGKKELIYELSKLGGKNARKLKGEEHPFFGKKRPEHSKKLKGKKVTRTVEHQKKLNNRFTENYIKNVTNSIARDWEIITPQKEKIVVHNMAEFCRQNKLNRGSMSDAAKKGISHKGYTCKKLG